LSAESYQESVADASLKARQIAFHMEKKDIGCLLSPNSVDVSCDSYELMIDAYKMVLLPAWIGEINQLNGNIPFYLNAENGRIITQENNKEHKTWWKTIFDSN